MFAWPAKREASDQVNEASYAGDSSEPLLDARKLLFQMFAETERFLDERPISFSSQPT
jgi:hypothetical protein